MKPGRYKPEQAVGLAFVLALHGAVLYLMWSYRVSAMPVESVIMVSSLIDLPKAAPAKPVPPPNPLPKPEPPPEPRQIAAETPVVQPDEVAAPPLPEPTIQQLPQPVQLTSELFVNCPVRSHPVYPLLSRRRNEHGKVVLNVELDEVGQVAEVTVKESSGYPRLDAVALETVRTWRCNPLKRDGVAVRAVALQPFNFILEGS